MLLFAAGFALASPDLSVGIEALFTDSDSATIVYTANEPADFTCQLGEGSSQPCGAKTTKGVVTYPVTAGAYTFSVVAQNTAVNKELHSIDTYVQTATTTFTVAGETAPAPPPPPVQPPPPPPPGVTQPDLGMAIIGHHQGAKARATVEVTNIGDGAAEASVAHLRVAGVTSRPRRVPALGSGHHYRLHLVMPVPSSARGHVQDLFAVVSPVPGETQVLNNIARQRARFPALPSPPPEPDGGTTWWPFAVVAVLLLLAGAAWFLLRGSVPGAEKLDWQLKASSGDLPEHCNTGQRMCKREGEFEPALRELLELTCAREPETGHELKITGEAVRRLSEAHAAYARNRPAEAGPLVAGAEALVWEQVSGWLGHGGRGGIHLDAKFEGSSASCTFKLFRCAPVEKPSLFSRARHALGLGRDDEGPWRELAHWKAEVKDTATVEIGTLDEALVWDGTRRADLDETLRSYLGRLAKQWVVGG